MASMEALSALAVGSVAFWTFFHRGEHFMYPVRYIQLTIITTLASTVFFTSSADVSFREALAASVRLACIFLTGVYANCVVYRLFLNPVNKIPGPYFARLTKFNHVFQNKKFNAHQKLLEMHQKYGKFVRIGPNDISVTDADGTEVLSGAKSKCTKGPWYDQDSPMTSLHTTRDRALHDRRRRVWAPAFSDKALRGYEIRVQNLNDLLLSKLAESKGSLFEDESYHLRADSPQANQSTLPIYSTSTPSTRWAISPSAGILACSRKARCIGLSNCSTKAWTHWVFNSLHGSSGQ